MTQPEFLKSFSVAHKYAEYIPESLKSTRIHSYLFVSGKDAITNWHIDFSWTSVFYSVVSGVKEFVVVKNSRENAAIFSEFMETGRTDLFFGSNSELRNPPKRQILIKNQGIVMPAGTIHMVRTAETSVAYGVNFIHEEHLGQAILQFISERERKPEPEPWNKCFPNFLPMLIAVLGRAMAHPDSPSQMTIPKFQTLQLICHVLFDLKNFATDLSPTSHDGIDITISDALTEFRNMVHFLLSLNTLIISALVQNFYVSALKHKRK